MPSNRKSKSPAKKRRIVLTSTLLSGIALASSLAGCAKEPEPVGMAAHLCRSWGLITPHQTKDVLSAKTRDQIVANNVANELWCPSPEKKIASK